MKCANGKLASWQVSKLGSEDRSTSDYHEELTNMTFLKNHRCLVFLGMPNNPAVISYRQSIPLSSILALDLHRFPSVSPAFRIQSIWGVFGLGGANENHLTSVARCGTCQRVPSRSDRKISCRQPRPLWVLLFG